MKLSKLIPLFILFTLLLTACASGPTAAPTTPTAEVAVDVARAEETLTTFFSMLHEGQYEEASTYYGGPYEDLTGFLDPSISLDEHEKIWESVCAGLLKCLPVRNVVSAEQSGPDEFVFVVEFSNEDGTLFELGPCCGATEEEMPTRSQFTYTVVKMGDQFTVLNPPVYVP